MFLYEYANCLLCKADGLRKMVAGAIVNIYYNFPVTILTEMEIMHAWIRLHGAIKKTVLKLN